eukprot:2755434-Pyramimonas_sp.AAC.1
MGAQPKAAEHGYQCIEQPRTELPVHGGFRAEHSGAVGDVVRLRRRALQMWTAGDGLFQSSEAAVKRRGCPR